MRQIIDAIFNNEVSSRLDNTMFTRSRLFLKLCYISHYVQMYIIRLSVSIQLLGDCDSDHCSQLELGVRPILFRRLQIKQDPYFTYCSIIRVEQTYQGRSSHW